jgi:hypothetical protein
MSGGAVRCVYVCVKAAPSEESRSLAEHLSGDRSGRAKTYRTLHSIISTPHLHMNQTGQGRGCRRDRQEGWREGGAAGGTDRKVGGMEGGRGCRRDRQEGWREGGS